MTEFVKSLRQCLKLTFPPVMFQLLEEILKPEVDFDNLAAILALDPILTATVLKMANSPVYGPAGKVTDLRRAATVLGTRELLKLAVSISFQKNLSDAFKKRRIDFFGVWRQTIWSAIAAELLAQKSCPAQAGEAYIAALMKDISLLIAACLPSYTPPAGAEGAGLLNYRPGQAEEEIASFGEQHEVLSAELLREWDFPEHLRQAVIRHHDFEGAKDHDPLSTCIILATRWAESEFSQAQNPSPLLQFKGVLTVKLGLLDLEVEELRLACIARFGTILGALGLEEGKHYDTDYRRHSLALLQEYYLLSQELTQISGGLENAAKVIARHLKWNWGLENFDLALWAAASRDWTLFSASKNSGPELAGTGQHAAGLPWRRHQPRFILNATGREIGELRLEQNTLDQERLEQIKLYVTFAGQAFEHYALRQAVLEQKAETLEDLPVGVARLDTKGRILELNAQIKTLAAIKGDPAGQDAWKYIFEKQGISRDVEWTAFLDNPEIPSLFKIFCLKKKKPDAEMCVYMSAHRRVWRGRSEIIMVLEDVTLVPTLEMQAIKQRDFLERLMDSMRDLVMTVDACGRVIYASPTASKGLLGRDLFVICTPKPPFEGRFGPELLAHPPGAIEVDLHTGPSKSIPLELVISPLSQQGVAGRNYLVVGRDLSAIRRLEEKLKRQAMFDGLTQLLNHFQFHVALEREVLRARRTDRPVGLMFLDLDNFKRYNDAKGHQAGDEALRKVADIMRQNSRRGMDIPCRYGGDEFTIIFTEIGAPNLEEIAGRIIETFAAHWSGYLGVSSGLAIVKPGESPDQLIGRADKAAYAAKTAGGNRFVWAE
ncbi:MAG: HDOD domain-containing protein [Desulfovibrionaceae bacterium]|nr:HDOD domain-containing protein [Desulfovibrionaceae bacterium]